MSNIREEESTVTQFRYEVRRRSIWRGVLIGVGVCMALFLVGWGFGRIKNVDANYLLFIFGGTPVISGVIGLEALRTARKQARSLGEIIVGAEGLIWHLPGQSSHNIPWESIEKAVVSSGEDQLLFHRKEEEPFLINKVQGQTELEQFSTLLQVLAFEIEIRPYDNIEDPDAGRRTLICGVGAIVVSIVLYALNHTLGPSFYRGYVVLALVPFGVMTLGVSHVFAAIQILRNKGSLVSLLYHPGYLKRFFWILGFFTCLNFLLLLALGL